MLDHLLEQRMSIYNALMDIDDQWTLASHVISFLKPFKEVTRKQIDQNSCISKIIPLVEILKRAINTSLEEEHLVTAKRELLETSVSVSKNGPHCSASPWFLNGHSISGSGDSLMSDPSTLNDGNEKSLPKRVGPLMPCQLTANTISNSGNEFAAQTQVGA
uniref:Uncharacterized protein n=1 Tax=Romanomermis culicivorax TaxID=13658 RepID=A0A915I814_ROMCU